MKKIIMVVLSLCFALSACNNATIDVAEIYVNEDESYFDKFEVRDGKVYIYCSIYIQNESHQVREVLLIGTFDADYKSKLLTEKRLVANNVLEPNEIRLCIPPGGKLFEVVFCGNHGGSKQKQNRLLPQVEIVEIVS